MKDGFRAGRLYELVYTAKDPLVLGVGLAATRDIVSFFRHAQTDAAGTPNPVAGAIDHAISVGDSQSGNFIRTFIHLGFNQDTAEPHGLGRRVPADRGAADADQPALRAAGRRRRHVRARAAMASSGGRVTQDKARGLKAAGLLDRCTATKTCPKIIEAFGSSEFWGLRMSPDLIGTDATARPRRCLTTFAAITIPGTTHGGGRGGFPVEATTPQQRVHAARQPESRRPIRRAR